MNAILIQHAYTGGGFERMLELTRPHHEAYCRAWNFEHWSVVSEDARYPMSDGAWVKISMIERAFNDGYEYVVWLDADTLIVDPSVDLRVAIQPEKIGACWHRIPQLNHWNVGALYLHKSIPVRNFVGEWLASYPPPRDGWFEQGVFNRLARQSKTVVTLSDKWNATLNVNMVPDAVVLGFHGQGDAARRYELMKQTCDKVFAAVTHG